MSVIRYRDAFEWRMTMSEALKYDPAGVVSY